MHYCQSQFGSGKEEFIFYLGFILFVIVLSITATEEDGSNY